MVDAWLSGPLPGVAPVLQPAAHVFVQARADLERVAPDLDAETLWSRPGGAASAGFHLKHMAGALDRLLTFARGERLSPEQKAALVAESSAGPETADALVRRATQSLDRALEQLRHTSDESLLEARTIGREALPTTVLGCVFHAAEHTSRHVGQLITTLKMSRAGASAPSAPVSAASAPVRPEDCRISLQQALARLPGPGGEPFASLFQHGTLAVEIFAPRREDTQKPHTRDEVYFVAQGKGEFVHGVARQAVGPGDFLFVPAGAVHRFENFDDDLALWVLFYGPEGGERS